MGDEPPCITSPLKFPRDGNFQGKDNQNDYRNCSVNGSGDHSTGFGSPKKGDSELKRGRSNSPRRRSPKRRSRSRSPSTKSKMCDEVDNWESSENVFLDTYNCDLNMLIDSTSFGARPQTNGGFSMMWSGVRANYGYLSGKVYYEVRDVKHIDVENIDSLAGGATHVVRVGWSTEDTLFALGEEPNSYGYGGTGKKSCNNKFADYGCTFSEADVIGAFLELTEKEAIMRFSVNGVDQGECYRVTKSTLGNGKALFPHIYVKNVEFSVNFGQDGLDFWFPPSIPGDDPLTWKQLNQSNLDSRVHGRCPPSSKAECEVIMMVGLPGAGKSYYADRYCADHKDKQYNTLGTNLILDKMKVMGLARQRNYHGRWDVLIDKATKCLNALITVASNRRRNYILDQTNVYPSAQRRKMRPFEGFKRRAIVIVPTDEEFRRRITQREKEEGKEVPESAVLEMKANFGIPKTVSEDSTSVFDEVLFTELDATAANSLVEQYNTEGQAGRSPPEKRQRWENRDRDSSGPRDRDSSGPRDSRWGGSGGSSGGFDRDRGRDFSRGRRDNYSRSPRRDDRGRRDYRGGYSVQRDGRDDRFDRSRDRDSYGGGRSQGGRFGGGGRGQGGDRFGGPPPPRGGGFPPNMRGGGGYGGGGHGFDGGMMRGGRGGGGAYDTNRGSSGGGAYDANRGPPGGGAYDANRGPSVDFRGGPRGGGGRGGYRGGGAMDSMNRGGPPAYGAPDSGTDVQSYEGAYPDYSGPPPGRGGFSDSHMSGRGGGAPPTRGGAPLTRGGAGAPVGRGDTRGGAPGGSRGFSDQSSAYGSNNYPNAMSNYPPSSDRFAGNSQSYSSGGQQKGGGPPGPSTGSGYPGGGYQKSNYESTVSVNYSGDYSDSASGGYSSGNAAGYPASATGGFSSSSGYGDGAYPPGTNPPSNYPPQNSYSGSGGANTSSSRGSRNAPPGGGSAGMYGGSGGPVDGVKPTQPNAQSGKYQAAETGSMYASGNTRLSGERQSGPRQSRFDDNKTQSSNNMYQQNQYSYPPGGYQAGYAGGGYSGQGAPQPPSKVGPPTNQLPNPGKSGRSQFDSALPGGTGSSQVSSHAQQQQSMMQQQSMDPQGYSYGYQQPKPESTGQPAPKQPTPAPLSANQPSSYSNAYGYGYNYGAYGGAAAVPPAAAGATRTAPSSGTTTAGGASLYASAVADKAPQQQSSAPVASQKQLAAPTGGATAVPPSSNVAANYAAYYGYGNVGVAPAQSGIAPAQPSAAATAQQYAAWQQPAPTAAQAGVPATTTASATMLSAGQMPAAAPSAYASYYASYPGYGAYGQAAPSSNATAAAQQQQQQYYTGYR